MRSRRRAALGMRCPPSSRSPPASARVPVPVALVGGAPSALVPPRLVVARPSGAAPAPRIDRRVHRRGRHALSPGQQLPRGASRIARVFQSAPAPFRQIRHAWSAPLQPLQLGRESVPSSASALHCDGMLRYPRWRPATRRPTRPSCTGWVMRRRPDHGALGHGTVVAPRVTGLGRSSRGAAPLLKRAPSRVAALTSAASRTCAMCAPADGAAGAARHRPPFSSVFRRSRPTLVRMAHVTFDGEGQRLFILLETN